MMCSGDGLDFVYNLFGLLFEFSVFFVDSGKTKKIVVENLLIGMLIVVEVMSDIVIIWCVDVFVIVKYCFVDEMNVLNVCFV